MTKPIYGNAAQNEIYKTLSEIERFGYSIPDIYTDWLEIMTAALQRDDDTYLKTLKRYERFNDREVGKRPADLFAKAYGQLCVAWKADNADHLGALYEQYVSQGSRGQFFTPEPLCELMAHMTVGGLQPGQTVSDPACGSGRNLLAAAKIQPNARFYGTDIDRRCVQMTALNLVHRNLEGVVVWGNTISLEQHGAYICRSTPNGGEIEFVEKTHEVPIAIMGVLPTDRGAELAPAQEDAHEEEYDEAEQLEIGF